MKKIFVVIVTYNGKDFIEKCLSSLMESSINLSILVIDNASSDLTVEIIKEKFPGVNLFELAVNLGFGKANNIGIKYAYDKGAEHVLLLNQDAYVQKNCVEKLVSLQEEYPQYGILSPLHLCSDNENLDSRFAFFLGSSHDKDGLLTDFLVTNKRKQIYQIDFVNAAIWMLSRKCIEKVGLFNPSFQHYGEDRDLSQRVIYFNFLIGIVPEVTAIHDRPQGPVLELNKYIQQKRADLIYRLSRLQSTVLHNLVSVFFRSFILSPPKKVGFVQALHLKIRDFMYISIRLPYGLKNRKIAIKGDYCFFKASDLYVQKYKKHLKRL